jgi:hypothetical protein
MVYLIIVTTYSTDLGRSGGLCHYITDNPFVLAIEDKRGHHTTLLWCVRFAHRNHPRRLRTARQPSQPGNILALWATRNQTHRLSPTHKLYMASYTGQIAT